MSEQRTLRWSDVVAFHAVQAGISTRDGKVRSILCNQSKEGEYADEIHGNTIFYRVTASTNPAAVAALRRMVGGNEPVRVYEKLGVNQWIDHDYWVVADCAPEGEGLLFLLRTAAAAGSQGISGPG